MKQIIKKSAVLVMLLGFMCVFVLPVFVSAESGGLPNPPTGGTTNNGIPKLTNPLNCGNDCTLITFINLLLNNVVMPIAAVLAVVYIIWAGFTYVMAQGNPGEITKAHQRLLWALIGTGVLLGAAGISKVIEATVRSLTT